MTATFPSSDCWPMTALSVSRVISNGLTGLPSTGGSSSTNRLTCFIPSPNST